MFNEQDIKEVKDIVILAIPKLISFGVYGLTNEGTFSEMVMKLWVVCQDEHKSTIANFTEMGKGRFATIP